MPRLRRATRVVPMLLVATVAACGGSSDAPRTVDAADAYVGIIRWEASEHPPEANEDGSVDLPVVYVASALGDSIDAGTQAAVVEATKDDAVVRFADNREDVVDLDEADEPVKDDNVMLLMGPVPEPARQITVDVTRYRSLDDQSRYAVVLSPAADGARVTSATEAPS